MTTREGSSRRSPELWFGVLAAIAIPTLFLKSTGLLASLWPAGGAIPFFAYVRLALGLAVIPLTAVAGFALRGRHVWAVGLLAGTALLLVPDNRISLFAYTEAPPFALLFLEWTLAAVSALVPMAVAATVLYRVRFADYAAVVMAVGVPIAGVASFLHLM